ncbi:MAG TPA: NADH-quinone oxidoreductase subunit L [Gemmatimonadales bacterium]|nr:NADH-quinone oxidoreductase subunit L [Gemmatimonadales bacterium]
MQDSLAIAGTLAPHGAVSLVWLTVALPLAGFLANGLIAIAGARAEARGRAPGAGAMRLVSVIGPGVLLAAFAVAAAVFAQLRAAPPEWPYLVSIWRWLDVGSLQIELALQVDQLSTVMLLIVTGVGSLIHLFSVGYMREDPGYARFFAYLNLFVVFMLLLVLGSSMPVLFIGWEGVGLCSYLLIGFWFTDQANADAGKKAFLVNRIGDFGFLIAMFLLWHTVGSLDFAPMLAKAPGVLHTRMATLICLFLLLGCAGKSAQIPLYVWLPDAMAGPTPVSALIHAATMVTAGVYLVTRAGVLFALSPAASMVTAGIGAVTALFAATIALRQYDIKKVLAYSTVSQLGYMFLAVGAGAYTAGIFHLVTHAFFKALLFLGAGSVIHAMHHAYHATHSHEDAQDMRNMGGLARYLPATAGLMLVATLAIAGIPPFSGFFSKDAILSAAFARGAEQPVWYLFYVLGLAAALLTAFYMARLMTMTFAGENRTGAAERTNLHEAPPIMTGPLVILGVLSLVGGFIDVPAFLGGGERLEHWLEPVTGAALRIRPLPLPAGHAESLLVATAVVVGVLGLIAGYVRTRGIRILPAREAPPDVGFARVLYHKYYVDEIYRALIVRPTVWFSRWVLWRTVDQALVDGLGVTGAVQVSRSLGWLGSRLQNGQLGFYAVLFVLGAVLVLGTIVR